MSLWNINDKGTLVWPLHKGQVEALNCEARFILMLAGTQSGKTSFAPCWLDMEMQRCGPGDYIAASASFPLMKLKLLPEFLAYFRGCLKWSFKTGDKMLVSPDEKYRVHFMSGHNPESLESATGKAAVLDEWGQASVPVESWEAIQRRLSLSGGRALIPTTAYNLGWLYQQVYKRALSGDIDYHVVSFDSMMNPMFPKQEYDRAQRTLPAWKFDMFYRGVFTRPAGLIFDGYEDGYAEFTSKDVKEGPGVFVTGGNIVRPFSIPSHWNRDVGIDFGASAHCARIWVAEDPATRYGYIYRDACGGVTNGQLGDILNGPEYAQEARSYNERVRRTFGGARSESEQRTEWAKAGFPVTEPEIFDVEAGIDHLNALFKARRWFIFDTCTGLRSELGSYSREIDAYGEPTEKIARKSEYHHLDAARYVASGWPLTVSLIVKEPSTIRADDNRIAPNMDSYDFEDRYY